MSQFKQFTPPQAPPSITLPLLLILAFCVLTYILLKWTFNTYWVQREVVKKHKKNRRHHKRKNSSSSSSSDSSEE